MVFKCGGGCYFSATGDVRLRGLLDCGYGGVSPPPCRLRGVWGGGLGVGSGLSGEDEFGRVGSKSVAV